MTELKETINTLQISLMNCLVKHKIYCFVKIEAHGYPYGQSLIFSFHITDSSDDRLIRELLHTLNINVVDSPLDPLSIPALKNFCVGVRKVILDLDKAYELLALLKLEGY